LSGLPSEVDALVRGSFQVRDVLNLPDDGVEYRVAYGRDSKEKFKGLWSELRSRGFSPWLTGTPEDCTLVVRKMQPPKPSLSRVPVVMALLTLVSILAFGLLEEQIYARFAPGIFGYLVVASYSGGIVVILAAHEFGHRYSARKRQVVSPTPYFIPGIPDFTGFLPSLGVVSLHREPALNKDAVFDVALAGPLAAFAVTVVLYAVGEFAGVPSSIPLSGNQLINPYIFVIQINPNMLQLALDSAFAPFVASVAPGYFKLSPVADAANIGFLLTFLSLLPMAFYDGGYLAASSLGSRATRTATYLSVIALVTLDTPAYWAPGIVVLLIASRAVRAQVLDEVSTPSHSKRLLFFGALLLAFLCLPLPQNIATIPLG